MIRPNSDLDQIVLPEHPDRDSDEAGNLCIVVLVKRLRIPLLSSKAPLSRTS